MLECQPCPTLQHFTALPDWVCEILSPSTALLDRGRKLAIYAREQVEHAWLIDPLTRTLEVMRLDAGRWVILAVHGNAEIARAEPFAEIGIRLADLWID